MDSKQDDNANRPANIYQRINAVMKEVAYVSKTEDLHGTPVVSHDQVSAVLHQPLADHGIVARPTMTACEFIDSKDKSSARVTVELWLINIDAPMDRYSISATVMATDSRKPYDKSAEMAYSRAVKQCYLKTFVLEAGEQEYSELALISPRQAETLRAMLVRAGKTELDFVMANNQVNKTDWENLEDCPARHYDACVKAITRSIKAQQEDKRSEAEKAKAAKGQQL